MSGPTNERVKVLCFVLAGTVLLFLWTVRYDFSPGHAFLDSPVPWFPSYNPAVSKWFPQYAGVDDFLTLCRTLHRPCGEVRDWDGGLGIRWVPKPTTPRAILDELVAEHPGYTWHLDRGVLVLKVQSWEAASCVHAVIPRFQTNGTPLYSAIDAVSKLTNIPFPPESISMVSSGPQSIGMLSFGPPKPIHPKKDPGVFVDLKGATTEDVLNAIVRSDGPAMWQIVFLSKPLNIVGYPNTTRYLAVEDY